MLLNLQRHAHQAEKPDRTEPQCRPSGQAHANHSIQEPDTSSSSASDVYCCNFSHSQHETPQIFTLGGRNEVDHLSALKAAVLAGSVTRQGSCRSRSTKPADPLICFYPAGITPWERARHSRLQALVSSLSSDPLAPLRPRRVADSPIRLGSQGTGSSKVRPNQAWSCDNFRTKPTNIGRRSRFAPHLASSKVGEGTRH